MRKYQQRRIISLIETFREAANELGALLAAQDTAASASLLADCQEMAQGVLEFIDRLTGQSTQTSAALSEYIAEIRKARRTPRLTAADLPERLDTLLARASRGAFEQLKPDTLEIVFFPYKASMWDSMESVWRAAAADPRCEVHVVPIPYYDRMPDGRMGRMHYELDQYPDDVPVTDYRNYNLDEHYPDAIFVHNPYDSGNHVTTVHPDYYNEQLREKTDMLCYIPYFVTGSGIAEHFCQCAGVIYAHKVFVESEWIRYLYSYYFSKYANENKLDRQYVTDGKIMALGSPKYDKVINAKPEDFTLPEAWRKLLLKPDGTYKKAVLYNTSLGAMLGAGESYVEKLRRVLDLFKAREDMVLWWRPHPLGEAIFKSMLPALREGYQATVAQYRREGWGIYDDTSDLHRALCLSSAYYGDGSSLIPMYQMTGKPLIIQRAAIRPGASGPQHNLSVQDMCEYDGYYWFISGDVNGLLRMDKETFEVSYMGRLPGENVFIGSCVVRCIATGGRVYIAPLNYPEIAVYDIASGAFECIALPEPGETLRPGFDYYKIYKFNKVLERGGVLYFLPSTYPGIVEYDTRNKQLTVIDGWVEPLGRICNGVNNGYFANGAFEGDRLYLPCLCANAVLEIDLTTRGHRLYHFGGDNKGYVDICREGGAFWLLPIYGAGLVRWEPEGGAPMPYIFDAENEQTAKSPSLFQRVIPSDGCLLMMPYLSARMLRFDPTTQTLSTVEGFKPAEASVPEHELYGRIPFLQMNALLDGKLWMHTGPMNTLLSYDPLTDTTQEAILRLSPEDEALLREKVLTCEGMAYHRADSYTLGERPFIDLEDYFELLTDPARAALFEVSREARGREIAHADGKAGEAIYGAVCEEVFGG